MRIIGNVDPLTRPARAGESAGSGPPSPPRGRGQLVFEGAWQGISWHEGSHEARLRPFSEEGRCRLAIGPEPEIELPGTQLGVISGLGEVFP